MSETPVVRWLRRVKEKLFGTFEEGPQLPKRLSEVVVAFANAYPKATRADWVRLSQEHGRICYQAGYQRGYEHVERTADFFAGKVPPDVVANHLDPDWKWQPGIMLSGEVDVPVEGVRDAARDAEDHMAFINRIARRRA